MKISSVIAIIGICAVPVIIGYQIFQWKADMREARAMAYICAENAGYFVDPLDMDIDKARAVPVQDPVSGKAFLYKGQTVKKVMVPSLTTQESRYKCTMYKNVANNGHWTVIPQRELSESGIE